MTTKLGLLLSVEDTYFEDYEYVIFVRKDETLNIIGIYASKRKVVHV